MDIFDSRVLARVVENLPTPPAFLLNTFFGQEERSQAEHIDFDVDNGRRRIAPFVSPLVAGQVVEGQGYQTKTFKPAYIKDKRVFDANKGFRRTVGEQIGGNLTPEQRVQAHVARDMSDQVNMMTRRLELMAAEALTTGKITVEGDNYPTTVVDFGRNADLTRVLTSGNKWGEAGVKPIEDLENWSEEVFLASGTAPTDVVMTTPAWRALKADAGFEKAVDTNVAALNEARTRVGATIIANSGARLVGVLGDLRLWVYSDYYVDPADNTEKAMISGAKVILTSQGLEGVRHFGAIRDEEAGFQPLPYFPKSWVEKDPAVRYLLMQSAPLVVPYRVNATMCATVL